MPFGQVVRRFGSALAWTVSLAVVGCSGGGGGGGGTSPVALLPVTPAATTPAPAPPPEAPATAPAPEPAPAPSAPGRVVSDTITSAKTGATYPLQIYLPASYDSGSTSYPVIYAMDGDAVFNPPGTRFENLSGILDTRRTEAVMVGIGGTSRREQDYLLPGARAYHDFLTQELVPLIESKYRADVKKRMLTGLSLSGSMAGIALLMEGASGSLSFSYFLSFEGSFDSQTPENNDLEQKMFDALGTKALPATLVLTRCENPSECNFGNVDDMYKRLQARAYPEFVVTETTYSTNHVATDIPSFTDAIAKLLP
jgi:enterochelin esterase-like enzyme